jgi:hypothetical protein
MFFTTLKKFVLDKSLLIVFFSVATQTQDKDERQLQKKQSFVATSLFLPQ